MTAQLVVGLVLALRLAVRLNDGNRARLSFELTTTAIAVVALGYEGFWG